MIRTLVLGTRGSALALAQTRLVADALSGDVETRVVRTAGDISSRPLQELGDGIFVTAIEDALRAGEIDAAVHSLKDLPTGERPGLVVAAILRREDPRDVLITSARGGIATLPRAARVGTSSPRRDAALRQARPDIVTSPIRGNVETRMAKVARGDYDATVLALAGLRRLGIAVGDDEILDPELMLPAPGQGAIAVQCRADDVAIRERLAAIDDARTRAATDAERELLRLMGGSCDLALGALATVTSDEIVLDAWIDGRRTRVHGRDPLALAGLAATQLAAVVTGPTVILTRARGENAGVATGLAAAGIASREVPCVAVRPLDDEAPLRLAVRALTIDDVLVITSRAGARAVGAILAGAKCPAPVAAVGAATAKACRDEGLRVTFVPSVPSAEALAAELPLPRGATVFARSDRAAREPAEVLTRRGAHVREVVAYHTSSVAPREPIPAGAIALFASPSAVDGFALSGATVAGAVAIGPSTAARVRAVLGVEPRIAGTDDGEMVDALKALVEGTYARTGR